MSGAGVMTAVAACMIASGCAGIETTVTYPKREISTSTSMEVEPGSQQLTARLSMIESPFLVLSVQQAEICRTTKTTLYRKSKYIARDPTYFPPVMKGGFGIAFAAGAVALLMAEPSEPKPGEEPVDLNRYALYSGIGAAIMGGLLAIDLSRLHDDEVDLGETTGDPVVTKELCHHAAAPKRDVTLSSSISRWTTSSKTDAAGRARFDLSSLGMTDLSQPQLVLIASFGDESLEIRLSSAETALVSTMLAAEPNSQFAKERWVALAPQCQREIDVIKAAFTTRSRAYPVSAELALLEAPEKCKGASNEGELRKLLGSPQARNLEREIRISLTSRLNAAFAANDAIAVVDLLRSPMAMEILSTNVNTKSLVSNVGAHWIAMLVNNIDSMDRAAQLCAVRKLYLRFVGDGEWQMIRADLASMFIQSEYTRLDLADIDEKSCVL